MTVPMKQMETIAEKANEEDNATIADMAFKEVESKMEHSAEIMLPGDLRNLYKE